MSSFDAVNEADLAEQETPLRAEVPDDEALAGFETDGPPDDVNEADYIEQVELLGDDEEDYPLAEEEDLDEEE